jgi:hypothetical protein
VRARRGTCDESGLGEDGRVELEREERMNVEERGVLLGWLT